jgi:hypothetical protein
MGKRSCIYLAVGLLLTVRPALGHHAFSAEFDREQPIRIDGTITKVDWTSPHVYVFMDVKDAAGKVTNWKVEFGRPEALEDQGWTQLGLTPGADVTVHGWRARNGGPYANAESITRDGGIRLSAASSYDGDRGGTGGPARLSSAAQPVGTTGELPGTATPLTLIGLVGLLSAAVAASLRASRAKSLKARF